MTPMTCDAVTGGGACAGVPVSCHSAALGTPIAVDVDAAAGSPFDDAFASAAASAAPELMFGRGSWPSSVGVAGCLSIVGGGCVFEAGRSAGGGDAAAFAIASLATFRYFAIFASSSA